MALTVEQIGRYVAHGGVACPFCSSSEIEGGLFDTIAGECFQDVWCNDCGKQWRDVYKLVGAGEVV